MQTGVSLEKCKASHARAKPRLRAAPFAERDVLFIENPIIEFRRLLGMAFPAGE